jgi:hypothetical protein
VRQFVANSERDQEAHPISPVDVARFRLLASMVGVSGNDETTLGAHDANVMFQARDGLSLGHREIIALMESGLDNFTSENVPLWHWYEEADAQDGGELSFISIAASPNIRVGALTAMARVQEPIKPVPRFGIDSQGISRERFIQIWFSPSSSEALKVAALEYLGVCGTAADLPTIKQEYVRNNYRTKAASIDALIRAHLRQSRQAAIKALYELQPETVDAGLILEVFAKPASLETVLLTDGATHRSATVRKTVVPILVARRALSVPVAEGCLRIAMQQFDIWRCVHLNKLAAITITPKRRASLSNHQLAAVWGFSLMARPFPTVKEKTIGNDTFEKSTARCRTSNFNKEFPPVLYSTAMRDLL